MSFANCFSPPLYLLLLVLWDSHQVHLVDANHSCTLSYLEVFFCCCHFFAVVILFQTRTSTWWSVTRSWTMLSCLLIITYLLIFDCWICVVRFWFSRMRDLLLMKCVVWSFDSAIKGITLQPLSFLFGSCLVSVAVVLLNVFVMWCYNFLRTTPPFLQWSESLTRWTWFSFDSCNYNHVPQTFRCALALNLL